MSYRAAWIWFVGVATAVSFLTILTFLPDATESDSDRNAPLLVPMNLGLPVRLKIPVINVDAGIEYVGITSDGAMGVPKSPESAGWFQFGPRPGETGSAVIDGHFGWRDNAPAVFDNLDSLRVGDRLYIEDDTGATVTFIVRETRLYNPREDAGSVFNSSDGKAHLNLITCEGVWDAVSESYSKRLVVFADRE
ncbi:MAG: peptidase C60 sortase A and B [Parcubacteria group bacterium Gr01-1014_91]|nr:MAG: peptidase C60 sortase A and B [Parcubacteria group bacterium Gr01-1014_91]